MVAIFPWFIYNETVPRPLGYKHTEETKYKIAEGQKRANGHGVNWRGGLLSKTCETCGKEYFIKKNREKKSRYCSFKCRPAWNKGRSYTKVTGSKNGNWKGGITPINLAIRTSTRYNEWRTEVFKRDNYLCVLGGKKHGNKLQADHIKPFSLYPKLRFDISNGRTLCVDCHRKTDTYGGRLTRDELSTVYKGS